MQLITRLSKLVFSLIVSCILLIAWYGTQTDLIRWDSTEIEETTTSVSSKESIWASISREFELDHHAHSAKVQAEIRKLLADREKFHQILKAGAPYIHFIHEQTRARGLPAELALIPFIESEFNPNDRSHKGALGLWQLMSGTAHELGVKIKSGYDGRRNVIDSTKAALLYFKDLGRMFNGNWYLAIAAYNCGQFRVLSAKKRTGSQNFWNLPLPQETKYYVPKLLAVAEIIQNPEKYGVELPQVDNEPYFTEVKVKKPVNLTQIAKSTGISMDELRTLNPDYKNGIIPKERARTLLVPIDKIAMMENLLEDSENQAVA